MRIGDTTANDVSRRLSDRRRTLKRGLAAWSGRNVTAACSVRNLSPAGAQLTFEGSTMAPDTFELVIEIDGLEYDCEVVRRTGVQVGVRFLGPPRPSRYRRTQCLAPTGRAPRLLRRPLSSAD
jgi:hypothetical protein